MSVASEIQAKWQALKAKGLDLGATVGALSSAGSGGYVQVYQRGRIYWHANTGAHEVHGGILTKYLAEGGPGPHPTTGRRHFGYPVTDEEMTADGLYPSSRFEFGEIDYVRGSGGGISIYGDFFTAWKSHSAEIGKLGHPLTAPVAVGGGEAVYFEGGCLWQGPASGGQVITCTLDLPQLGRPQLINPTNEHELRLSRMATWWNLPNDVAESIFFHRPGLFRELWTNRLVLRRVNAPGRPAEEVMLTAEPMSIGSESPLGKVIYVTMTIPTDGPTPLRDATLYNVGLRLPTGSTFAIAPHSIYIKRDWSHFGLIHATDIHVSQRLEGFRNRLRALAQNNPALAPGVDAYVNFNDGFRDLIRYANHLHDIGMLDAIMATGDLVDYGFEAGQRSGYKGGNYAMFEQMVRGQLRAPDGAPGEELRVPIFTTMGNHDYRVNPYYLLSTISTAGQETEIAQYASHNLTEAETVALQGGHPTIDLEAGAAMLRFDINNQRREYEYYLRRINRLGSYVVKLGDHRLVMLDTKSDDLTPPSHVDWQVELGIIIDYLTGNLSAAAKQAQNGRAPNSRGLWTDDVNLLRGALAEAGSAGLVIVGMHAPPFLLKDGEFAHYFRQTERPTANRKELYAFLMRHMSGGELLDVLGSNLMMNVSLFQRIVNAIHGKGPNPLSDAEWETIFNRIDATGKYRNWTHSGAAFKTSSGAELAAGALDHLTNDGIALDATKRFLHYCAGIGSARPADLVLFGHHHDRVEFRLRWDSRLEQLQFFNDFYTENPTTYYSCTKFGVSGPVELRVRNGASPNGNPTQYRDHRYSPAIEYATLEIPPYANPLSNASDPRSWWQQHRPLMAETASLGPIDRYQRSINGSRLNQSFQGFRLVSVHNNVIDKVRYVPLRELRQNNFYMPWESSSLVAPVEPGPVLAQLEAELVGELA
jgi:hypothetical protein